MIHVGYNAAKSMFFDRRHIRRAVDEAERRVLSKFGAFVRQRARTSIRKRKAVSKPGSPPSSHVGTLRKTILFGYDRAQRSVVIGPTQTRPDSIVPRLLEFGGAGRVNGRTAHYRPRPFMGPAFAAELPALPPMWRNAVR